MNKHTETYWRYWGKAKNTDDGGAPYHLLPYHSLDVAAVGLVLLNRHPSLLRHLSYLMQLPEEQSKLWCIFLLGLHDLGKFAESFQQLRTDLRGKLWPDQSVLKKDYSVRHDSLGAMLWNQTLKKALFNNKPESSKDFIEDAFKHWLAPVFGHHGWPPSNLNRERVKNHFSIFDQQAAEAYYQKWSDFIQPDFDCCTELAKEKSWSDSQKKASWLIAGIAVLSDWLGSNQEIFKYHSDPMSFDEYWEKIALPAAEEAVNEAGLLPPMIRPEQELADLFPYIETPTPLQDTCTNIGIHSEPQLFILEDVTGAGKTEAALILVHRLIDAGLAEGIYIGLPTMATANAMYERMVETYQRFYAVGEKPSLILSHSARHLSEKFQQSLLSDQPQNQSYGDEENITAQCNRWLADNRKKALLADVGIGTIDQALLAVMPSRHQSLRLLGLLNKVLILDEVHAYDPYTSEPLKNLIRFHAAFGGSTILLSATLTHNQRESFIRAFQGGGEVQIKKEDYPLLSRASVSQGMDEIPLETRESVRRKVDVAFIYDETRVLEKIRSAVDNGQCICWIRNTVTEARSIWQTLIESEWIPPENLHLFHSRYTLNDRIAIEQRMLKMFGKESTESERTGQVLIATQVVEQSLDLDFDAMISDLAPIDLLIQRAGRLQRHQRGERGNPVLHIYSPPQTDDPQADWYKLQFPKAHYVYPDTTILWRSAKILAEKGGWSMPNDARELLSSVYNEGEIPPGLEDSTLAISGEIVAKRDAGIFATLKLQSGYSGTDQWDEEARIATRLGEDTHTIYLAKWENGVLTPWVAEGRFPWDLSSLRVNQAQLSTIAPIEDGALRHAIEELKSSVKLFDENSLILPIRFEDGRWSGVVLNEKNRVIKVIYSAEKGLELNYE